MVLGVQREHPAGADDEMVDVGTLLSHGDGMQGPPPGVALHQLGELCANGHLAVSAQTPRAFLGVHAHQPGQNGPHRCRRTRALRLRTGQLAGCVRGKVAPGIPVVHLTVNGIPRPLPKQDHPIGWFRGRTGWPRRVAKSATA
jgi:hypothetical protein